MSVLKTIAATVSLAVTVGSAGWAQSLIRDTEIEHVMRGYADPIIEAAGLDPNDVDFYLVADPQINAFVTGGQNIFMHTGMIVEAGTPNQLKGVIAHETGHITGAHLARSATPCRRRAHPCSSASAWACWRRWPGKAARPVR